MLTALQRCLVGYQDRTERLLSGETPKSRVRVIKHLVVRDLEQISKEDEGIPRSYDYFRKNKRLFAPPLHRLRVERGHAEPITDVTTAMKMMQQARGAPGFVIGDNRLLFGDGLTGDGLPLSGALIEELRRAVMHAGRELHPEAKAVELFYENFTRRKIGVKALATRFRRDVLDATGLSDADKSRVVDTIVRAEQSGRTLMPGGVGASVELRYIKLIAYEGATHGVDTQSWHTDGGSVHAVLVPLQSRGPDILGWDHAKHTAAVLRTYPGSFAMMTSHHAIDDYPGVYATKQGRWTESNYTATVHRSPYLSGNRLLLVVFYGNDPRNPRGDTHPRGFQIRVDDPKRNPQPAPPASQVP
jgi:hypothetical protein